MNVDCAVLVKILSSTTLRVAAAIAVLSIARSGSQNLPLTDLSCPLLGRIVTY